MLRINRWGALLLSATLLFSVTTGCGKTEEDAKAKDEAAQTTPDPAAGEQNADESPIPIVDVNLGMDPKDIVATYEGGELTAEQFENYLEIQSFLNPQAGFAIQQKDPAALEMFVKSYVAEISMAKQAPELKTVEDEAKQLLDRIKGQYLMLFGGDEKKLEKQMKDQGVTDDELKEFFVRYKQVEAYLRNQVTEDELTAQYEKGKQEGAYVVASVRHILISVGDPSATPAEGEQKPRTDEEAKKLADEITDRLRKGEDFDKLAKEFSEDPGSKDNGGLYKDADVSQWVPEFKQAAIDLPLNTISDPVKTDFGYHVMKVEDRKEKTFDEVKEQIRADFVNTKYDEFLDKQLNDILKEVNLPEQPKQQ